MTSNYLKIITLSDLTRTISMADPIAISVKTMMIDSRCSLDKEFSKLINTNS